MRTIRSRLILAVACGIFVALGMLVAGVGPLLPDLSANTRSGLEALGGVFTALFLGAIFAQLVAGPLSDTFGQRPVLIVGLALLAGGMLGVGFSRTLVVLLTCTLVAGLGFGAIDVGNNVLVAEVFAGRGVTPLNLLHLSYGAGAVIGPALASLFLRLWGTALPMLWIGIGLLIIFLPVILVIGLPSPTHHTVQQAKAGGWLIYRAPLLWSLGAFLLVAVGVEQGIGGWTTAYIDRSTALGIDTGALITSGFWLALTAGRLLAAVIGTRLTSQAVLLLSLVGSILGGIALVLGVGQAIPTIAATLLLGLSFGPLFPTTIAITSAAFRRAPGRAVALVQAMSSIGGVLFPWIQGALLVRLGPFSAALFCAGLTVILLVAYGGIRFLARNPAAPTSLAEDAEVAS